MDLEQLAEATLAFLRAHLGLYSSEPTRIKIEEVIRGPAKDERRYSQQFRFAPSELFNNPPDSFETDFEDINIEQNLTGEMLKEDIASKIPDSPEYVVVDLGCRGDRPFAGPLAKRKKNILVFGVDKDYPGDDVIRAIQQEIPNFRLIHKKLELTDQPQLDFLAGLEGKTIFFTGFRTPADLSYIVINETLKHQANCLVLTPSGMQVLREYDEDKEYTGEPPNSAAFPPVSNFMTKRLDWQEPSRLESLLRHMVLLSEDIQRQHKAGIAIKQLVILDYALLLKEQGYAVRVFRYQRTTKDFAGIHQPDHIIYAFR